VKDDGFQPILKTLEEEVEILSVCCTRYSWSAVLRRSVPDGGRPIRLPTKPTRSTPGYHSVGSRAAFLNPGAQLAVLEGNPAALEW